MRYLFLFQFLLLTTMAVQSQNFDQNTTEKKHFSFDSEQFADLKILRYPVPGFENLTIRQKELAYYLYEAALWGREIIWDQNGPHNLAVKQTLEEIVKFYKGDKKHPDYQKFLLYTKRIWFANGLHHHYSSDKLLPDFSPEFLAHLIKNAPGASFPLRKGESTDAFIQRMTSIMCDPLVAPKGVSQDPDKDLIANSAMNYYRGVSQKEVEDFYSRMVDRNDPEPVMHGLNSRLEKRGDGLFENVYRLGGLYSPAIEKIVYWLEKAQKVAETKLQEETIGKLIEFYRTGDLAVFDEYSILWTRDTLPAVDFVNGFIEVYGDPMGYRGAWQSMVTIRDEETTRKYSILGREADWFEKNAPIDPAFKKEKATGVSYKVVNVVVESGDNAPSTPIGVNLPNSNWIRVKYGSKSVSLGNIETAYEESSKNSGLLEEFHTPDQVKRISENGAMASRIQTGLHEVIGHGSGRLKPGVGTPKETLKNYASPLEEARADLVALYFISDPYLVKLGITSPETGKAAYDQYIVNGLMKQLIRIKEGNQIEQAHMRNRSLICHWVFEAGKKDRIIERISKQGRTFFVINDYEKLRELFGNLLREVQRIKSTGDYETGKKLVEDYGVKVDPVLHHEVLSRLEKLSYAPFAGFIQPVLKPVFSGQQLLDVQIEYPADFSEQMLYYSDKYHILPTENTGE